MENNNPNGKVNLQRNPDEFQIKLEEGLDNLETVYLDLKEGKGISDETYSRMKVYQKKLHCLKVPRSLEYTKINNLIVKTMNLINKIKDYEKEKGKDFDMLKDIQPVGDPLGVDGDIYDQRKVKIEGKVEFVESSLDSKCAEETIAYLKMFGFEDVDTLSLPKGGKSTRGKITMYEIGFNEIASEIVKARSEELNGNRIRELEEKIEDFCSCINKESFWGEASYKGGRISYTVLIPKLGEILKKQVKEMKGRSIDGTKETLQSWYEQTFGGV